MADLFKQIASEGEDIALQYQTRQYGSAAPVDLLRISADNTVPNSLQLGRTVRGDKISSLPLANSITDPGTGKPIPVDADGYVAIVTAGAETNTLPDPTYRGQRITLNVDTFVGNRVITAAHRINKTANTVMTFPAVGACIELVAITIAGALRWEVSFNDGVTLA